MRFIQLSVLTDLLHEALDMGLLGGFEGLPLGVLSSKSLGFIVLGLGEATHVLDTCHGLGGRAVDLIGSIAAVVVSITSVGSRDAASITARELVGVATSTETVFVTHVPTIVVAISQPSVRDATVVVASEFIRITDSCRLITVVSTIVVAIISEHGGDTATVVALPLVRATCVLPTNFI